MRFSHIIALSSLLIASPALAGTVSVENGETVWSSTECKAPDVPKAVLAAQSESHASDINQLVLDYNTYVGQAQLYMNCLSAEGSKDADFAATTISDAAKKKIDAYSAGVSALSPVKREEADEK